MANKKHYVIVSGEGEMGIIETAHFTKIARMRRLTKERCGGDRWCRITLIGDGETPEEADNRGRNETEHLWYDRHPCLA